VEDIQDRFFNLRNTALDSLMDLIGDIKTNKEKVTPQQLATAQDSHRKCSFMIDFVMSENSMGFHAPQEAMRILGDAINTCRVGQIELHGGPAPSHNPPNVPQVQTFAQPTASPGRAEMASKSKTGGR
jgi:nitrite reductase (cytochrome c-552)